MQRVKHDLYYIENWSILLDLYIVVMTPFSLFRDRERLLMAAYAAVDERGTSGPADRHGVACALSCCG